MWLSILAWLLALVFAAWVSATLFWRLTAPTTITATPRAEADPRMASRDIVRTLGGVRTALPASTAAASDYVLIGLATGFGGRAGFAVLRNHAGETQALLQDERLADGLRLQRILPDRIELAGNGRTLELRLAPPSGAGITLITTTARTPDTPDAATPANAHASERRAPPSPH